MPGTDRSVSRTRPIIELRDAKAFGELVRQARVAADLRQVDLADAAGVGYRFVLDLEAGKETCQLGKALRVLAALGIPLTAGDRHQVGSVSFFTSNTNPPTGV